jgi:glycosyltransferase involved in cell wall biosynthesis
MTAAPVTLASFPAARSASRARAADLVIATLNRETGDTGVHAHTRVLRDGMRQQGIGCDVVSPFSGSRLWLPIFAVRPALLKPINRTWSTLWYRHWHLRALRRNLLRRLTAANAGSIGAVVAQCPVSARAALDVRTQLSARWPVSLVCHFNHSEAREYREKGELRGEKAFNRMIAGENAVLAEVDHVVYVSGWARDVVEIERGVRPRSSCVIWNGLPDTAKDDDVRPAQRAMLGIGDDELALVNVGTLEPRKNQAGLVDLFADVAAAFPQARLLLVGDGPLRSGVEQRVHDRGLQAKVKLLGMRRDVPAILNDADIYVHFATAENCPVVLIEAARAGLPMAAAPVGGVPELLRELGCGVELHLTDRAASLRALSPLLGSPDRRGELGCRARAGFERRFTRDAMVKQYMCVFEE